MDDEQKNSAAHFAIEPNPFEQHATRMMMRVPFIYRKKKIKTIKKKKKKINWPNLYGDRPIRHIQTDDGLHGAGYCHNVMLGRRIYTRMGNTLGEKTRRRKLCSTARKIFYEGHIPQRSPYALLTCQSVKEEEKVCPCRPRPPPTWSRWKLVSSKFERR